MNGETELVTVFRSADDDAQEDAAAVRELLEADGLNPVVLDDSAPGVPEGVWEVRVPQTQLGRAEELVAHASLPDEELKQVDPSSSLNVETVFRAPDGGATSEMEALSIKSVLDDAGIASVLIGDTVLPNLAFEVRVAREQAAKARAVIEEAKASGPAAAEEGADATGGSAGNTA